MEFSVNVFGYASSVVCPFACIYCPTILITGWLAVDRIFFFFHKRRFVVESAAVRAVHHWGAACRRLFDDAGEPTVGPPVHHRVKPRSCDIRWLIDNDKDDEGMQVIADLHGGDPEDLVARAEFQEIKERVLFEVGFSRLRGRFLTNMTSARVVKVEHTKLCGKSTNDACFLPCHLRHSPNL